MRLGSSGWNGFPVMRRSKAFKKLTGPLIVGLGTLSGLAVTFFALGQAGYLTSPVSAQAPSCSINQITSIQGTSFAPDGAAQASISDDGTRIAFTSGRDPAGGLSQTTAIYLYDANTQQFTTVLSGFGAPPISLSGDGTKLAFSSNGDHAGQNADGNTELFVADLTQNAITYTQVTNSTANGFLTVPLRTAMNHDGSRVAFFFGEDLTGGNHDLSAELFIADLTSAPAFTQVTNNIGPIAPFLNTAPLSISADGTKVVYTTFPTFNVLMFDSSSATTTPIASAVSTDSDISSDGTRIALMSNTNPTGGNSDNNPEFFLWGSSTGFSQLTDTGGTPTTISPATAISGDGSRILFGTDRNVGGTNTGGEVEFYLYDDASDSITQITDIGPSQLQRDGSINRDGTRIAFTTTAQITSVATNGNLQLFLAGCTKNQPPVALSILESIFVSDLSGFVTPVILSVSETIGISDVIGLLTPVVLNIAESIGINDALNLVGPAIINIVETLTFIEFVAANGPATVHLIESVGIQDTLARIQAGSGTFETIREQVPTGGVVSTDWELDGATIADPIETTILAGVAGQLTTAESAISQSAPSGFAFLGQQVSISAPTASALSPHQVTFRIDQSLVPAGQNQNSIQIFKDGVQVLNCSSTIPTISPDPCVSSRLLLADGDVSLTVLTSSASIWLPAVSLEISPRNLKLGAINKLTPHVGERDAIELAIKLIEDSLEAWRWVDDFHLARDGGGGVFRLERQAVLELQFMLDYHGSNLPAGLIDGTNMVIDDLVEADRILADTKLQDALSGLRGPDIDEILDRSQQNYDAGTAAQNGGNPALAIARFWDAWTLACEAIAAQN